MTPSNTAVRLPRLATVALTFLRLVVGAHFFVEGLSHLRDPSWSSAGFRRAAVGPLAQAYRGLLPQVGDWSGTLGCVDDRTVAEAADAWRTSVVEEWRRLLDRRTRLAPLDAEAREAAERRLAAAETALRTHIAAITDDLAEHRRQAARLAAAEREPGTAEIPFARDRSARRRAALAAEAAGWMGDAAAIGRMLVVDWDRALGSAELRARVAAAVPPSALWKADRFVSWSLATIGGCLLLGLFVRFNAVGGAIFLATVAASQPFWVADAQPTWAQWVEMAALLALASLPSGRWSGLDHVLVRWCPAWRWRPWKICEVKP